MTDWRRIQGRIRKARTSKDAPKELAALYESTRDAMVAFELARLYEKDGSYAEAAQWYTTAAGRFRRAQWKVKAQEALSRLGVDAPVAAAEAEAQAAGSSGASASHEGGREAVASATEPENGYSESPAEPDADGDQEFTSHASEASLDTNGMAEAGGSGSAGQEAQSETGPAKKRRRRGRRGGAKRRKKSPASGQAASAPQRESAAPAPSAETVTQRENAQRVTSRRDERQRTGRGQMRPAARTAAAPQVSSEESRHHEEPPTADLEGRVGPAAWHSRKRAGEPAIASRIAKLEAQLRRMLAGVPHSLDDADRAPAGPGVFILSDSDLLTDYYVECCQTLRIGVGNLLRSGRTQTGENIRGQLGEHLGINESRVAKYLKDHCAVRWLQLDEGAAMLAHFAISVLRPALNA